MSKYVVLGASGLVGSAIVNKLRYRGINPLTPSHGVLDLTEQYMTRRFFSIERPDYVFLCAARVGGIVANSQDQAGFLYENLMINANVISSAAMVGVRKLVILGSSCIYPRMAPQPIKEEYLMTGPLEPTNEGYALAKITALRMGQMFGQKYGMHVIPLMPTNLYGPGDNYHPMNSHVIPGMLRKFHEAKEQRAEKVVLWGTGAPRREFLHVDDLAEAVMATRNYTGGEVLNVGTGQDVSIMELASLVKQVVGFKGEIEWDTSKPDGTPRKVLDVSKIKSLGWEPKIGLVDGLINTYEDYRGTLK
jgi:Nucleoside-diphosphate-sugar epimerases